MTLRPHIKLQNNLIKIIKSGDFKSISDAMRKAGYSETTINKMLGRTVGSSGVKKAIEEALENSGITDELLTNKLKEGLDATKVISAVILKKDGKAEDAKEANESTMDFVDVPDFGVRHKYLETGLKLKGHLSNHKVDVTVRRGIDEIPLDELLEAAGLEAE